MNVLDDYERQTLPTREVAEALPLGAYSDSESFGLEMERIFRSDWVAICGENELAAFGDYYALRLAGEPIVVIRGTDGVLRALSNVCRHRGTPLYDDGRGNATSILCPYHAWCYDDRGRLTGVPTPGSADIDKSTHGLAKIPLETWRGVVFIHLGENAKSLAPRLAGLDRYIDPFRFDRFATADPMEEESWNANWKLVYENAMDWYHLFQAHPKTLNPIATTQNAFNIEGSPDWTITASRQTHPTPARSGDPRSLGTFEREHYFVVSIPPNIACYATADGWGWILVLPESVDRTTVCGGGQFSTQPDGPAAAELAVNDQIMEEDRILCERIQKGMSSRVGRGGQLVELDRAIKDFHHYLGSNLFGHEPARPWKDRPAGNRAPRRNESTMAPIDEVSSSPKSDRRHATEA